MARSRVTDSPALAWAKYYLDLGIHVFPIAARSKVPPRGFEVVKYRSQAPTQAELEAWFGAGRHNVAIMTGRGIVAVDLDGPGAEEALAKAGVELPKDAPRSQTSNGAHVLLRVGGQVGNSVKLLASEELKPGTKKPVWQVDIRGDGGYVVAPPSTHESGHVYEWERRPGRDIPTAPASLLALMRASGGLRSAPEGGSAAAGGSDAPGWVSEALAGVGEGSRDTTCARLAGYFLGKGVPADIVRAQLYAFGERCTPPFSRAQVDKTVASVARRESAEGPSAPFQILGYNSGSYYYLPKGSRQVADLRADQHTKLNLLRLAPMQYWEGAYADRKGVAWDMAANALIRLAERAGVYDVGRIRGRGAWWDGADAVLHVGDSLVTAGTRVRLEAVPSGRYVYEAAPPMTVEVEDPLDDAGAVALVEALSLVNWERPISAQLLAGWCAVAPVCGALSWRPHVWLTGPAGTGKTWVVDRLVRRLLGELGLAVQSETTEAGLRQTLGHDARPVVFDEIEGEDQRAQQRVQNVLALARQASSETGAVIIKGSPLGGARSYRIRSCFAFSSIGVGVDKYADSTRVSVLSIQRATDEGAAERFRKLEAAVADTVTDQYVKRFIARSVRLVPQIRANAAVLARAGAEVIGSQRLGDQVGALLAGCYSLYADDLLSPADARRWVEGQDWSEQRGVQEDTDESACLRRILERVVRVSGSKGPTERSLAELARVASAGGGDDCVSPHEAASTLGRVGLRVDGGSLIVSNSHTGVAEALAGTQWAKAWGRTLRRIPGARGSEVVRFGAVRGRGTEIPLTVLTGE